MSEFIDRGTAERLAKSLMAASSSLDEAAAMLNPLASSQSAMVIKKLIADAMTTIGWDILEQNIYSNYQDLRPYDLARPR